MQVDNPKTIPSITRHDGLKTAAFVLFCLIASIIMLGGMAALWLLL